MQFRKWQRTCRNVQIRILDLVRKTMKEVMASEKERALKNGKNIVLDEGAC